ncbi:urease accessory protein UreD, partial [Mycobacterium tuberculosis]|nr:urease accessory protein UreD [Mycobacterium tuberculosis]
TDDSAPIGKTQKTQKSKKTQENSNGYAVKNVTVYLQDDSRFEWLPQENCFYNASFAHATNQFFISPAASVIAWEINLLG